MLNISICSESTSCAFLLVIVFLYCNQFCCSITLLYFSLHHVMSLEINLRTPSYTTYVVDEMNYPYWWCVKCFNFCVQFSSLHLNVEFLLFALCLAFIIPVKIEYFIQFLYWFMGGQNKLLEVSLINAWILPLYQGVY